MLTCKEVTHRLSEGQDRQLTMAERMHIRIHLAMCKGCTQYEKQIQFIRKACKGLFDTRGSR